MLGWCLTLGRVLLSSGVDLGIEELVVSSKM